MTRWACRGAGLLLLLVPLVPIRAVFPPAKGGAALVPPTEWVLGLAIFGLAAWVLASLPAGRRLAAACVEVAGRRGVRRAVPWVAWAALACLLVAVSAAVFEHRPLLVDSVVQLFQARVFASGQVAAPAPAEPAFFLVPNLVTDGARWYAQYPPGHPALLALGVLVGAPWVVPVLLTLGAAVLIHRFVLDVYGEGTAALAAAILVLAPFFWFLGASFMSHVSALFFLSLSLVLFVRWEASGRGTTLAGLGAAMGGAFLCRPLEAVAVGTVLAAIAAAGVVRRRGPAGVAALLPGAAAFLLVAAAYPAFNALTTGDALVSGYQRLWGADHGLGFHVSPWGEAHTPWTGLRNELTDLALLDLYLFEWPIPALLPLGVFFAAGWAERGWDRRLLACFLAVPAAYFFYWHQDDYMGPRFLYAGLAFLVPLTARAVRAALLRLPAVPRRRLPLGGEPRAAAVLLLAACCAWAVGYSIPRRFQVYASGMPSMKTDVRAEAGAAGIDEALVFVPVSWGNRLLAGLRAGGAPASLVERAYRSLDHCRLHGLLERAGSEAWSGRRLSAALEAELREAVPLAAPAWNGDPTLRLRPHVEPAGACLEEIAYDRRGYGVYLPHLAWSPPGLDGGLIVARDLRERNAELARRYPDRPAYLYRDGRFVTLGPGAREEAGGPEAGSPAPGSGPAPTRPRLASGSATR